jgi:hypothetical protein
VTGRAGSVRRDNPPFFFFGQFGTRRLVAVPKKSVFWRRINRPVNRRINDSLSLSLLKKEIRLVTIVGALISKCEASLFVFRCDTSSLTVCGGGVKEG